MHYSCFNFFLLAEWLDLHSLPHKELLVSQCNIDDDYNHLLQFQSRPRRSSFLSLSLPRPLFPFSSFFVLVLLQLTAVAAATTTPHFYNQRADLAREKNTGEKERQKEKKLLSLCTLHVCIHTHIHIKRKHWVVDEGRHLRARSLYSISKKSVFSSVIRIEGRKCEDESAATPDPFFRICSRGLKWTFSFFFFFFFWLACIALSVVLSLIEKEQQPQRRRLLRRRRRYVIRLVINTVWRKPVVAARWADRPSRIELDDFILVAFLSSLSLRCDLLESYSHA